MIFNKTIQRFTNFIRKLINYNFIKKIFKNILKNIKEIL